MGKYILKGKSQTIDRDNHWQMIGAGVGCGKFDWKSWWVSPGYAWTYCCPTRGIVLGLLMVGMVGMKGVVGGSEGRRGEWGDRLYGVMGWK